ncbi:tryptophanase [Teredinibacter sp. KSP-S5-2]|uniref:tryptophanase n=1 Tax=Teredinibacter sp. KSP-S5-2 TaxID=3034506 RepID=UPI0029346107|nr:tryptophanase [Teredinibacter sp. KSP-S5-2]WNO10789.1 tryptophanase [Teredinibacter sp. KSP-S5-2]
MNTVFEPYRIKSVELLKVTTEQERKALLREAFYNVALLKSDDVLLDFLTDSGISAMSSNQWAAVQLGDESYVRSPSYEKFQQSLREIIPFKHIIPTHQGRSAERILASLVTSENTIIPNNAHFDTTKGNIMSMGGEAVDLLVDESRDLNSDYPFKGNMDIDRLASLLKEHSESIPLVFLTITNNSALGQPVSMQNIRATRDLCHTFNIPLFFDGCRFAENAYMIKQREEGYANIPVREIIQEMFSYVDGMTMSAKKDALVNTGGWLALNDDDWAKKALNELLLTQGFVTYGGLSGRDLEAIAVGVQEGVDEHYLKHRIKSVERLASGLDKLGIPVVKPYSSHAVYVDATRFFNHIDAAHHPGQTLNVALYESGGIRACELNSIKLDNAFDKPEASGRCLIRMAIPRRVYTQSHLDYVVEVFDHISKNKTRWSGLDKVSDADPLYYYGAKYQPVT